MFERFTDRARRVVVLAQEEARMLNHNYIGTEHLLLGLIHEEDGIAARVLASLGVEQDLARDRVEEIIGRGETEPGGHIPFTPRAKRVLELSLREAQQLGHNYIGTEHLLLGLIREGEGVGAQALLQLDVELDRVRREIAAELRGPAGPQSREQRRWFRRREPSAVDEPLPAPEQWLEEWAEPWRIEQFDDGAWDALIAARRSARDRGGAAIGTRDLLLGVALVAGPGSDALRAAGVDTDALRSVEEHEGRRPAVPPAALAYTDAAREALHGAADEGQRRDHAAAGTAHILYALLLRPDEELTGILDGLDAAPADLHAEAARRLAA
ncbi:MAG: hypothetical protein KY460_05115 [Actinobacteria bacterium]|nr:hypothetical protein [Actinomycetota bacterium]